MPDTVALVVAAGRGLRFGGDAPKQYAPLGGRALLSYSLARLAAHPRIPAVRAVIHRDDRSAYDTAAEGLSLLDPVWGGATRQESVRRGLESLIDMAPEWVLIHDGARPFPAFALIDRLLDALSHDSAAIAALPVTDTLKREHDGHVAETIPREGLWRAQTPQAFHFSEILRAHRAVAQTALTDDAAVAEAAGLRVALVQGCEDNVKITTPEDLLRAERRLAATRETRVGSGFDVHRFGDGDAVWLCGVRIPHEQRLIGHSDADVGLHALTDALLGALGKGDIGTHFPPQDARWKGAESALFLRHAADLLAARGGRILSLDLTLICERPKIAPHRPAMLERVGEILQVAPERVSIKATTSEGLGFTGRREGIAAQAVVTIELAAGP